jgi:hypothetical protein
MNTKTLKFGLAVLPLAATLILSTLPARATLLVYEGFNYTTGDGITNDSFVAYQNPVLSGGDSFGWGGRWGLGGNAQSFTNVATSLHYTDLAGNSLLTEAGSAVFGYPNTVGTAVGSQPARNFAMGGFNVAGTTYLGLVGVGSPDAAALGAGTTNYWISFEMQWDLTGPKNPSGTYPAYTVPPYYTRKGDIMFKNGATGSNIWNNGTEVLDVGSPSTNLIYGPISSSTLYDNWSVWTGGDAGYTNGSSAILGAKKATNSVTTTTFVLMELVLDTNMATLDTVYTWFNWTNLLLQPDISTASMTNTTQLTGINGLRMDANSSNGVGMNPLIDFDEFRLGNTYGDVAPVPEPTAIGLSAVGGGLALALLAKRRRNSRM